MIFDLASLFKELSVTAPSKLILSAFNLILDVPSSFTAAMILAALIFPELSTTTDTLSFVCVISDQALARLLSISLTLAVIVEAVIDNSPTEVDNSSIVLLVSLTVAVI